jgi:cell division topological specificity factor
MEFLRRLFGRPRPTSAQLAKERLQMVLTYDRVKFTPKLMDTLRGEIIGAISKHLEIDEAGIEITITKGPRYDKLVANIPVKRSRQVAGSKMQDAR